MSGHRSPPDLALLLYHFQPDKAHFEVLDLRFVDRPEAEIGKLHGKYFVGQKGAFLPIFGVEGNEYFRQIDDVYLPIRMGKIPWNIAVNREDLYPFLHLQWRRVFFAPHSCDRLTDFLFETVNQIEICTD